MPIKVFPNGYAETDTPEEAAALLRLMNQTATSQKPAGTVPVIRNEDDAVTQFFAAINENARRFLGALSNHRNGVKADEFGEETGFTTDKFGGILGGASKLAAKYNLDFGKFVVSEMRHEKHMRYRFLLPGDMLLKHGAKLVSGKPVALNFASVGAR